MADLLDTFSGSAGNLIGHTSDSGHTLSPSGTNQLKIDGSNHAYTSSPTVVNSTTNPYYAYYSWVPDGNDYQASVTLGSNIRQDNNVNTRYAITVRHSGASGSQRFYGLFFSIGSTTDVVSIQACADDGGGTTLNSFLPVGSPSLVLTTVLAAGDIFTFQVRGSNSAPFSRVLRNGYQILTAQDGGIASASAGISLPGSVGILVSTHSGSGKDVFRQVTGSAIHSPGPAAISLASF